MKFRKQAVLFLCLLMAACSGCSNVVPASGEGEAAATVPPVVEQTITITCAGDCTLGTDSAFGGITLPVELKNRNGDYSYFLKNVQPYFSTDDLTIVNLEGTLTDRGSRADKTFAFRGDPSYTRILTQGSVEAVTLANNHSRDYGTVSSEDTKNYLEQAGIAWVEGLDTQVLEVSGVKVGLVGLNALNGTAATQLPRAISQVEENGSQWTVVQIHWGIEGDNYPMQSQIDLAHQAIDLGADLVIGHHPHVLQGMERYQGKMIAYSLGNFCFGGNQNPGDKDTMLFRQSITLRNGTVTESDYQVIPCSISSVSGRNNYQPTPATGSEAERIANKIQKFSDRLGSETVQFAK